MKKIRNGISESEAGKLGALKIKQIYKEKKKKNYNIYKIQNIV